MFSHFLLFDAFSELSMSQEDLINCALAAFLNYCACGDMKCEVNIS